MHYIRGAISRIQSVRSRYSYPSMWNSGFYLIRIFTRSLKLDLRHPRDDIFLFAHVMKMKMKESSCTLLLQTNVNWKDKYLARTGHQTWRVWRELLITFHPETRLYPGGQLADIGLILSPPSVRIAAFRFTEVRAVVLWTQDRRFGRAEWTRKT